METTTVSRRLSVAAPVACGCALLGIAAFVARNDPVDTSILPPCPFYVMTGRFCPGCGLTRAMHALLNGDVFAAIGFNLLVPAFLAAIVIGWLAWMRTSLGRRPMPWLAKLPVSTAVVAGAVVLAFGVARNLPGMQALAP